MKQREKCFGDGRPLPMDRNVKRRLLVFLDLAKKATEPGKHYGAITSKAFDVARALLLRFHNERTGLCFPSYEEIAQAAGCNPKYVAECLKMLERLGVLTWCHRLKRVARRVGGVIRQVVERSSNGYRFVDPATLNVSIPRPRMVKRRKSELPGGTRTQRLSQDLTIKDLWIRCNRGEITFDEAASEVARLQAVSSEGG